MTHSPEQQTIQHGIHGMLFLMALVSAAWAGLRSNVWQLITQPLFAWLPWYEVHDPLEWLFLVQQCGVKPARTAEGMFGVWWMDSHLWPYGFVLSSLDAKTTRIQFLSRWAYLRYKIALDTMKSEYQAESYLVIHNLTLRTFTMDEHAAILQKVLFENHPAPRRADIYKDVVTNRSFGICSKIIRHHDVSTRHAFRTAVGTVRMPPEGMWYGDDWISVWNTTAILSEPEKPKTETKDSSYVLGPPNDNKDIMQRTVWTVWVKKDSGVKEAYAEVIKQLNLEIKRLTSAMLRNDLCYKIRDTLQFVVSGDHVWFQLSDDIWIELNTQLHQYYVMSKHPTITANVIRSCWPTIPTRPSESVAVVMLTFREETFELEKRLTWRDLSGKEMQVDVALLQSAALTRILDRIKSRTVRTIADLVEMIHHTPHQLQQFMFPIIPLAVYVTAESGMGKTTLAGAVAAMTGRRLLVCSGSDLRLPNALSELLSYLPPQGILLIDEFVPPTSNDDPFAEALCLFLDQVECSYVQINRRADCVDAPDNLMWCRPGRVMRIELSRPTIDDVRRLTGICFGREDLPDNYRVPATFGIIHEHLRNSVSFEDFCAQS